MIGYTFLKKIPSQEERFSRLLYIILNSKDRVRQWTGKTGDRGQGTYVSGANVSGLKVFWRIASIFFEYSAEIITIRNTNRLRNVGNTQICVFQHFYSNSYFNLLHVAFRRKSGTFLKSVRKAVYAQMTKLRIICHASV